MTIAEDLAQRLHASLAPLQVDADLDLVVVVGTEPEVTIRFQGGEAVVVPECDPTRAVRLHVTETGAEAVLAGSANAQRLLATGELTIGGRIDVLQANAAALAALGAPSDR